MTFRAVNTLKTVDLIAAEDTRHTLKLLTHFAIKKRMISYHQHNERERGAELVGYLKQGLNIAVVTDAGMPGISDPGNCLVAQALAAGLQVVPIPGASAVITALAASGLDTASFYFQGFLPRKTSEQVAVLTRLAELRGTLIFYEAPHRLAKTLKALYQVMGARQAVLARELTKIHEEFIRADLGVLVAQLEDLSGKGEYTVLVAGASRSDFKDQNSTDEAIGELLKALPEESGSLKAELKKIAQKTGKSPKEIYRFYLQSKDSEPPTQG